MNGFYCDKKLYYQYLFFMEVKETISGAPSYNLKITFMEKMQSRTRQGCFLNAIFHLQNGDFKAWLQVRAADP